MKHKGIVNPVQDDEDEDVPVASPSFHRRIPHPTHIDPVHEEGDEDSSSPTIEQSPEIVVAKKAALKMEAEASRKEHIAKLKI